MRRLGSMLAALAALAAPAWAQDTNDTVQAARLAPGETMTLDAKLTHPAWQRAPVYERFVEKDPVFGAAPVQRTRVQVLFDERAIWVAVRADETDVDRIRDVPVRADGVNRTQDFVVVYIDAIGSRQSAQFFRVNAAGSTADGLHTAADDSEDFAPDFDWDAAVARDAGGWTALFRLPFASLRFAEGRQDWRFMVARRLPRDQFHLLTSVPIPRDAPSFIDRLQPLAGVSLPEHHAFLTLRPSLTLRRERHDGTRNDDVDASLDIKWRPRAELVIDGTLNPDFSQVALDVPQLAGNTKFALSFPEKRPFFFESADLLRTPTEAFYTRSFTAPRWGLRGTWRGPVWAGSSFVVDDRGGGLLLLPGPYSTGLVDQPASRSWATRLRGDLGSLQAGGLMALRRYEHGQGSNDVLGADAGWQIDPAWRLRAQWLHSRTDAFTASGASEDGDRVYARLWRLTDDGEFSVSLDESTHGFRADAGFVNQVGVRHLNGFASRGWHGLAPFNEFYVNFEFDQVRERGSGILVSQDWKPGIWFTGARNLEANVKLHPQSRVRTAASAPLLTEHFVSGELVMTPAGWFPLVDTILDIGRLADTTDNVVRRGVRWTTSAKLRPLKRLELEPYVSIAWLRDADGRLAYRESAVQWLAVWHFDARQTLRAIVQRGAFDRRGASAFEDKSRIESLTYAFRYSAGTVLYVGASRSRIGVGVPARSDEAFVKLQFDVDEARSLTGL
jgi:hypothetical protein